MSNQHSKSEDGRGGGVGFMYRFILCTWIVKRNLFLISSSCLYSRPDAGMRCVYVKRRGCETHADRTYKRGSHLRAFPYEPSGCTGYSSTFHRWNIYSSSFLGFSYIEIGLRASPVPVQVRLLFQDLKKGFFTQKLHVYEFFTYCHGSRIIRKGLYHVMSVFLTNHVILTIYLLTFTMNFSY